MTVPSLGGPSIQIFPLPEGDGSKGPSARRRHRVGHRSR